jgi:hypothetical protein
MRTQDSGPNELPTDAGRGPAEVRETRQFGIRGLMWFTLFCALWCPQPMIFKEFWAAPRGFDLSHNHINMATVLIAWVVLLGFCCCQKFYGIFACHLLLPLLGTLYVVWRYGGRNLGHGLVLFVLAMNIVCFPGASLAMISRWLHRGGLPARSENDPK